MDLPRHLYGDHSDVKEECLAHRRKSPRSRPTSTSARRLYPGSGRIPSNLEPPGPSWRHTRKVTRPRLHTSYDLRVFHVQREGAGWRAWQETRTIHETRTALSVPAR